MLLSGILLPYQGIAMTAPETVRAAEQGISAAAEYPDAAVYAVTTAKPAATTAKPVTTRTASTTAAQTTTDIKASETGFEFEVRDGAAVLTEYTGSAAAVKIPSAYQGVPVTEIGDGAFRSNGSIVSVEIPASVIAIGANAFSGCRSLKSATLPEQLETIGYYAFEDTAITEIRIPASLKTAKYQFDSCSALEYAELAEGMETVPAHLFEHVYALKTVHLASTTKSIGQSAFASCRKLSKIEPPDIKPDFTASSFEGCDLLFDQRFCLLDRTASGVTVNSVIGSVSSR